MFRLLAIKVQKECKDSMRRCLVPEVMYYINNEYVISESANSNCTISKRSPFANNIDEKFYKIDPDKKIRINVSAIVGENGSGKSTLMELLLRAINNAAIRYEILADKNELVYVDGLYISVYFESDASVFRLTVAGGEESVSLTEIAKITSDGFTQENRVLNTDEVKSCFFYTLVSNYSHYAYNTFDYRNEWVKQNDEDTCWLKWLFHKNDGYQAPLTLHPFRDKGSIDIEREKELSNQRLLYFFIDYGETTGMSGVFDNIKNKSPKYLNLVEVKRSKLQENTVIRFFQEEKDTFLLEEQIGRAKTIGVTKLTNGKLLDENAANLLKDIIVPLEHLAYNTMGLGKDKQSRHYLLFQTLLRWITKKDKEFKAQGKLGLLPIESDLKKLLQVLKSLLGFLTGETHMRAEKLLYMLEKYSCLNLCQLQRIELIDDVCDFWSGRGIGKKLLGNIEHFDLTPVVIVKNDSELTQEEKCYHYIVYKTIDIFETYTRLYNDPTRLFRTLPLVFSGAYDSMVAGSMQKAYGRLMADVNYEKSHVTLKLRQTIYYLKHSLKGNSDEYVIKGKMVEGLHGFCLSLDNLAEYYTGEGLREVESLPPPIYERHFIFETTGGKLVDMDTFSSGEKQLLNTQSAIVYHLRNLSSIFKDSLRMKFPKVNIILEEIELYFHPEYQRRFIDNLLFLLEHSQIDDVITDINIIIVTHSPFILSDIPKCNVLFLKDGRPDTSMQSNTFGANIHNLLKNGFFLPGLPMGEFAHRKIDELFAKLNSGEFPIEELDDIYRNIMLVGEPVLRNELFSLCNGYRSLQVDTESIEMILRRIQNRIERGDLS